MLEDKVMESGGRFVIFISYVFFDLVYRQRF